MASLGENKEQIELIQDELRLIGESINGLIIRIDSMKADVSVLSNRNKVEIIKLEVVKHFGIGFDMIESRSQRRDYVWPRFVFVVLVKEFTTYSLAIIGKMVDRDHTSVMHAITKVEDYRKTKDVLIFDYNVIHTRVTNILKQQ